MSRRFTRLSVLFVLLFGGEVWAIGLGDIKLDSALNEPLRAQIALLSVNADELADLSVNLASAETFARYGIDRPFYLQGIEFEVVDGGANGSIVEIRSRTPITEPFLTFLVEATWSSGRLLREYTVLLDPPTFAPPALQQAPSVSAPARSTPSDSGRIERTPTPVPAPQARPAPRPSQSATAARAEPKPQPPVDDRPYSTNEAGDFVVQRGDTLWRVASRMRPDYRLTMNQMMLAIFEANPDAFGGNINHLKAGANLRVPSADEVYQIDRGDASSEVERQHSAWGGDSGYTAPDSESRPSLTLVPPDEDPVADYDDQSSSEPLAREDEIENRIAELEAADVPNQQSLIEIRDNELAALRQELADIRGEIYEAPVVDVDDDLLADDSSIDDPDVGIDDVMGEAADDAVVDDDQAADATAGDDVAADDDAALSDVVRPSTRRDKGLLDKALEFLIDWGVILGAVLLALGGLIWFMRRGDDDDDDDVNRPWDRLDSDDFGATTMAATSTMHAPSPEEAIVVVEQDSGVHPILEDTVEAPATDIEPAEDASSGAFGSLEDTFSSETAVNLDQTDPIAEADFHMAYGLYDQAADLINGALESDPGDKALMSKLCEIYFVWGNKDAFVDTATRLQSAIGDSDSGEWDKIVIMGQQIAADHALFAGAGIIGATREVDLSFEESDDATGALDMDFGADDAGDALDMDFGADAAADALDMDIGADDAAEIVDLGGSADATEAVDFDLDVTAESQALDPLLADATAEMPSPTIEEQFEVFDGGTSELPSLDASLGQAITDSGQDADATAEINLDDLDLGGVGIDETEVAAFDDLDITGQNEALVDLSEETGKNPEIDPDATGNQSGFDPNAPGLVEGLDLSEPEGSGINLARDETGQNPMVSDETGQESGGFDLDESLLDATGLTQVLSDDMVVDTSSDLSSEIGDADATLLAPGLAGNDTIEGLSDDLETMLAPLDDDDDDFDFAKTEALPPEAFTGDENIDATSDSPAIAQTDVDLDLDDLTAALQVSEIGDTVEQPRDDATVEQPRPSMAGETAAIPTMSLAPEEMSSDLHDARTMTEVGTKLDLARAYVDMGDPSGARSILEEVLQEGDDGQKQQAQQLLDSLPS